MPLSTASFIIKTFKLIAFLLIYRKFSFTACHTYIQLIWYSFTIWCSSALSVEPSGRAI
jgi:hypothetical protein